MYICGIHTHTHTRTHAHTPHTRAGGIIEVELYNKNENKKKIPRGGIMEVEIPTSAPKP